MRQNINSGLKANILIVEDNFITSFHLQKIMQAEGFDVSTLKKAEEVEVQVKNKKPDVILLDIMLAGKMTGIEAAENLRQFCNSPIIFLSALTDQPTLNKMQSISNAKNMPKPFNQKLLIETVRNFLSL